jgi:DNA repair protein SbcC/Rad50
MRLHRLEMRAFGPFPGTETVDFDALTDAGLFLLHGETGAGKTSVLDAVGFALYGSLPGARGTSRLLSDHAAPGAEPQVTLELTLRGRRLVVTRSPAHRRPKRRGEGYTDVVAAARLEEVTPSGRTTLATRAQEVGHELGALLPLTGEQFFQVVLLPQGEFARFLRSDTAGRAALLSTLFGIERFERVERWFVERRIAARDAVDRARERSRLVAARVAQAAGLAEDDLPEDCDGPWLVCLLDEARRGRDGRRAETVGAEERLARAAAERDAARDLARRQERRRLVERREAALAAQGVEIAALEGRLRQAEQAAPLRGVLEGAGRAALAADSADAEASARLAELLAAVPPAELPPGGDPPALRAAAARWREEVGRLQGLADLAAAVDEERRRLVKLRAAATAAAETGEAVARKLAAVPERRRRLAVELDASREARARLEGLRERCQAARALAEASRELVPAVAEVARLSDEERLAHERWLDARKHFYDLRERRIDGMRAELASVLEDGTPCPVCGSLSHPELAELQPTHVDSATEREAARTAEAAQRTREQLQTRLRAAENRLARLRGRIEDLLGHGDAEPDVDALERVAAELAAHVATEEARAAGEEELTRRCAALEAEVEALAASREESTREAARLGATAEALQAELLERSGRLDEARGGDPDVDTRARRLDGLAVLAEAAAGALEAARDSRDRARRAVEDAAADCSAAGFPDPGQATAALIEADETAGLRARVLRHARAVAEVRGLLDDDDLAVAPEPRADPEAAQRALDEAERVARDARSTK